MSLEDDDDDQLALDEAWRRVLCDEGIDIFKHPASDLQYVAPKILSTVREAAFTGGPRALAAALPQIRSLVDEERKAIEEQDLIDGLHIPREAATSYADGLSKADHAAGEFGAALQAYIQGNLGLTAWWQENTVSFQRRRELIVPAETLLPLAPMLNRPTTVYRNIAVEQPQVEFLRPGHQAVDHCQWLLLNDMRGRAFIMWRCLPDQSDIKVIFRFIFYSEINLSPLREALASIDPLAQNSLLRLVRQWFPSRADELWLELLPDGEYAEPQQSLVALCRNPYQKNHDRNMGEQRACHVLREFGDKRWKSMCHMLVRRALPYRLFHENRTPLNFQSGSVRTESGVRPLPRQCGWWRCANTCRQARFTWEMACQTEAWRRLDGHVGSAPTIPVWKTSVYLSTLMPEKWNPVLELHQPLRLCRPPPELIGQRDTIEIK